MLSKLSYITISLQFLILACLFSLASSLSYCQKDTVDILPPQISKNSKCGEYSVIVTDNRRIRLNEDTINVDLGIRDEPIFYTERSYNFSPISLNSDFVYGKLNTRFSFQLSVKDKYKEAFAVFAVYDVAYNFQFDSVSYSPELLEIAPFTLGFGNVFIGKSATLEAQVTNITNKTITIKDLYTKSGTFYRIKGIEPDKRTLEPGEFIRVRVEYTPLGNNPNSELDRDSLIVETECLRFGISLLGVGVLPLIEVADIDFGAIPIGKKLCNTEPAFAPGVRIHNPGTGQLILDSYLGPDQFGPFYINETIMPGIRGRTVLPGADLHFHTICFEPDAPGEFFDEVRFLSNANGPDSICRLRAISYYPGLHFQAVDFGTARVGDSVIKYIVIKNDGDIPIDLTGVFFNSMTTEYKLFHGYQQTVPSFERPVRIHPMDAHGSSLLKELHIPVLYVPSNEGYTEMRINLEVSVQGNKSIAMFNYVRGFAFLPKIYAKGYEFTQRTLVNNTNPDTGFVFIRSFSETADLRIKNIRIEKSTLPAITDFIFLTDMPKDYILKRGNSIRLPVLFRPEGAGERSVKVIIYHDAYKGVSYPDKFDSTIVYVTGVGYNQVLAFDNLIIESAVHCTETSGKLRLKNISTDKEVFLMDIKIISGDIESFRVDTTKIIDDFVILQPGETHEIDVFFNPKVFYKNYFEALIRVFADVDTATALVKVNTIKYEMDIKLDTLNNVVPGMLTLKRERMPLNREFPISLISPDLDKLSIRKFLISLKFKKNDLRYFNAVERGLGIENWHTLEGFLSEIDSQHNLLEIFGEGDSDLIIGDNVIKPGFIVMLGDSGTIDVSVQSATFFGADSCVIYTYLPGQMNMSYCGSEIRNIIISSKYYNLWTEQVISSTFGSSSVIFTVAIESETEVKLFNSNGDLVETISNKILKPGEYVHELDLSKLTSGLYIVTMKSGPYYASRKFYIMN